MSLPSIRSLTLLTATTLTHRSLAPERKYQHSRLCRFDANAGRCDLKSWGEASRRSRRTFLRTSSAAGFLAALPLAHAQSADARFGIKGKSAPAIHAEYWIDPNGNATSFDMAETEGRWVYLKCFQAWCPGCHKHGLPALKKVADAFADDDRVVPLAVQTVFEGFAVNSRDKLRETQAQYDLQIKFGHDPGTPDSEDSRPPTMRAYRTGGTPWVVIIDPGGRVIYNDYHIDADRFIELLNGILSA